MLKQQTKLRVRLYARLSKDDGDADKESNSITNQLQMLRYNAKEKGFEVIGEYVDPENKRKLLVNPDTAPIVKRIFELSKQGNSVHQIARTLCEDGVLIPRAYRAMKKGTLETSTGFKFPTDWVAKNVKMILENQVYLGHMVSHKTQTD